MGSGLMGRSGQKVGAALGVAQVSGSLNVVKLNIYVNGHNPLERPMDAFIAVRAGVVRLEVTSEALLQVG